MANDAFSYDLVEYPSQIYPQSHPDRLAVMARLLGLDPPDPSTARVLEIGGGDGMNVLSLAAAWPQLKVTSFDLSEAAVARGCTLRDSAGLKNAEVRVGDILDEAAPQGGYDYVIAHGVYAWVPEPVRAAIMRLMGAVLSPHGVGYISYNALPGGYFRRALRDMILHEIGEVDDPGQRTALAHAALDRYIAAQTRDTAVVRAMKEVAEAARRRNPKVLFHDELGDVYAPQSLAGIAAEARGVGLAWLTDADHGQLTDGFLDPALNGLRGAEAEDRVIHAAQSADYLDQRAFRESLFVRADAPVTRSFDATRMDGLYVSARGQRVSPTTFKCTAGEFDILDITFADALANLMETWPQRRPVADIIGDPEHREALFRLFDVNIVDLHALPLACRLDAPEKPCASPLVRAQLHRGDSYVMTLDQRVLQLDAVAKDFIALLDGQRDTAELNRLWAAGKHAKVVSFDSALIGMAKLGLLSL